MNLDIAEFLLIVSAVGSAIAWLIKMHSDKRKENAEFGKIDTESWGLLRGQVKEMEKDIVALRERVEILEEQLEVKDATIQRLETRLNKILVYLKGLFQELNERGVQYTPPEKGLMDTDPNIKPIK